MDLLLRSGLPILNQDFRSFPPLLSAAILAIALIVLTRALHIDGFMDCCDALFGGFDRERRLEILRDPRAGAFAVTGVVSLLLLKVAAIAALPAGGRMWTLLLFPCVSRGAVVMAMDLFPYVRSPGIGTPFLEGGRRRQIVVALLVALLATFALAGPMGILLAVVASTVAWAVGAWASRQLGGVTGDVYGAIIEIAEVSILVLAALMADGSPLSIESPLVRLLG